MSIQDQLIVCVHEWRSEINNMPFNTAFQYTFSVVGMSDASFRNLIPLFAPLESVAVVQLSLEHDGTLIVVSGRKKAPPTYVLESDEKGKRRGRFGSMW